MGVMAEEEKCEGNWGDVGNRKHIKHMSNELFNICQQTNVSDVYIRAFQFNPLCLFF